MERWGEAMAEEIAVRWARLAVFLLVCGGLTWHADVRSVMFLGMAVAVTGMGFVPCLNWSYLAGLVRQSLGEV